MTYLRYIIRDGFFRMAYSYDTDLNELREIDVPRVLMGHRTPYMQKFRHVPSGAEVILGTDENFAPVEVDPGIEIHY